MAHGTCNPQNEDDLFIKQLGPGFIFPAQFLIGIMHHHYVRTCREKMQKHLGKLRLCFSLKRSIGDEKNSPQGHLKNLF